MAAGNGKAGRKGDNFSEDWFLRKGYTKNSQGGFDPPLFIHKVFSDGKDVVIKEKVNNSTDFTHKPVTEWFIPGEVPSKKNSRQNFVRGGKQVSIPSKRHEEYVNATKMYYNTFGIEFRNTFKRLELKYPVHISMTFIRGSKRRFDYCNAAQTIEDLIVRNGWIEDDSADHLVPVFEPYGYEKNNGGVRIKILV